MAITTAEADRMYEQWRNSGTDLEFTEYFGLSFAEIAEITKAYADEREKGER